MESIYKLLSILFDFTLIGASLFFIVKFLQFRSNLIIKNEIQNLRARVSILRINLKAKVKKRTLAFRNYFTTSIAMDGPLDKELNLILDLNFEVSREFQRYSEAIKNIHLLVSENHKDPLHPIQNYLVEDANKELTIIRFIKEIKDISKKYNEKVKIYNKKNPKKKLELTDPIQFDWIKEIEQILKHEKDNSLGALSEEENKIEVA